MNESTPKRTAEDIEVVLNRTSVGDWLTAQRKLDMTRDQITEDTGVLSVVLAYFIQKQEGPGADLMHWLNAPMSELTDFLNIEEDAVDNAKKEQAGSTN